MLSIQFYSHLNWAGLPASSDSSVNCNSSESTVTNSLWPHIMSDGFQEKCLWLDTIMYSQPAIKVHRLSSVNASCVCMWGSTKCLHKYWCHVCIHTHKHHLTAVIHHSPQTYMLAHLRLCHPHLSLCLSERLRQSFTPFFSQLGEWQGAQQDHPSLCPSLEVALPADGKTPPYDFLLRCVCSDKVSEGCKACIILLSQWRFT